MFAKTLTVLITILSAARITWTSESDLPLNFQLRKDVMQKSIMSFDDVTNMARQIVIDGLTRFEKDKIMKLKSDVISYSKIYYKDCEKLRTKLKTDILNLEPVIKKKHISHLAKNRQIDCVNNVYIEFVRRETAAFKQYNVCLHYSPAEDLEKLKTDFNNILKNFKDAMVAYIDDTKTIYKSKIGDFLSQLSQCVNGAMDKLRDSTVNLQSQVEICAIGNTPTGEASN